MIAALTNHLWQSTLFAGAIAVLAHVLRQNRAGIRHGLWFLASVKFLVPFAMLIALGGALAPVPAGPTPAFSETSATVAIAVERIANPFESVFVEATPSVPAPPRDPRVSQTLVAVWATGFIAVVAWRLCGWRRIAALLRASTSNAELSRFESPNVRIRSAAVAIEPGVVGFFRPVLLLPAGIETQLTQAQLDAVVAHELCHVRRRDNLTGAVHMVVEALFWFHPLVWWIGAKLVHERERACDEHVLQTLGEPQTYAEGIVAVCKRYLESPIVCVSGVTGANLKRRLVDIVQERIGLELTRTRRVTLIAAAMAAILLPLFAGVATAPLRAGSQDRPQSQFEVASIRPCPGLRSAAAPSAAPSGMRRGGAPWTAQLSPGYVRWDCATLAQLVDQSFADREHPLLNVVMKSTVDYPHERVRGGPSWARLERFTIEARADVRLTEAVLSGSQSRMLPSLPPSISQPLRTLLEDRFQVKVRRDTEQQDMYALTVGKSGLNKERITAPSAGDCLTPAEYAAAAGQGNAPQEPKICGRAFISREQTISFTSSSMGQLAEFLSGSMDRYVLDRTRLDGPFNFVLYPQRTTGTTADDTLRAALEPLGLRISSTTGPSEYLVIERAERPRPDGQVP